MPPRKWRLNEADQGLQKALVKMAAKSGLSEDKLSKIVSEETEKMIPAFADDIFTDCKARLPEMVNEYAELEARFRERNYSRWKEGFDLLQMLIVTSHEAGGAVYNDEKKRAEEKNDLKLGALASLHARAVLVSREIFCLLKGGFPDGALGRWRTLHEIAVVATFLSRNSQLVSKRYLAKRHVIAFEAAKQYREYEKQAGLEPFGDIEFQRLSDIKEAVVSEFGFEFSKGDWSWAKPELSGTATFFQIEKAVGLDHWRPRYKWACADTHGNYRPPNAMLGVSENRGLVLLAGESNSAMADPAQMMAISLAIATSALMTAYPTIDRLAMTKVMDKICDDIANTFTRLGPETLKEYRRKRRINKSNPLL